MKKSFSPTWDKLVAQVVVTGDPTPLTRAREIELGCMSMVLFPHLIQRAWDDGECGSLADLAEWIAVGIPRDLARTDPVLCRNLRCGLREMLKLGWDKRLKPDDLRARAVAKLSAQTAP